MLVFFFKQKTAYEIVSDDWSSDVCSSILVQAKPGGSDDIDAFNHYTCFAIYIFR